MNVEDVMQIVDLRFGPYPIGRSQRFIYARAVHSFSEHFEYAHDDPQDCDEVCEFAYDLKEAMDECFNSTWKSPGLFWRFGALLERLTFVKR